MTTRIIRLEGKTALVTGAGTGIGRGIALGLARRGARVVLCGRRPEPLAAVAAEIAALGGQAAVAPGNVTLIADRQRMLQAARSAFGSLDVLVNNAGVLASGSLLTLDGAEIEAAVATNLAGPIDLTRLALPHLMHGRGAVVFIGSTTSHVPLPYASLYSATKSGLHAFCAALRYELAPLGVHLLEAWPPTVATDMTAPMAREAPPWLPPPQSADAAGERIVQALAAGRSEVQWGAGERLLTLAGRLAPRLLARTLHGQRRRFAIAMRPAPPEASGKGGFREGGLPRRPPSRKPLPAQLAAVRAAHPVQTHWVAGHAWSAVVAGSDDGKGNSTVLLLPGLLGEADTSFQSILALQEHWRVISLGYPATLDRLAPLLAGLETLLARLGAGRVHIVGGSYSGLVAQLLAAQHPARVASLLLSNTGAPGVGPAAPWRLASATLALLPAAALQQILRGGIGGFLPAASPVQAFWRDYFAGALPQWSKAAILARLRLMAEMLDRRNALEPAAYRGPILIVDAEDDRLISPRARRALAALYPQAQHVRLARKGHVAALDEAEAYIRLYRDFLHQSFSAATAPERGREWRDS